MSERPSNKIKEGVAKRSQGIRYALIGLVIIGALLVLAFPVRHFVLDPNTGPTRGVAEPAPTTVKEPSLTNLQAVRAAFAPWQLLDGTNAAMRWPSLVMLRSSGGIEVSAATVDFQPQNWTSTKPFILRSTTLHESRVDISTSDGKLFSIGMQQPFIFEQEPQHVYLITSDGTVWQASAQAVKDMQK